MTTYNQITIPVADAIPTRGAAPSHDAEQPGGAATVATRHGHLYAGLMLWTLIHFTAFGYIVELGSALRVLVLARYLLWPATLLLVMLHVGRVGGRSLVLALGPIMGFFGFGVLTGLIGFEPFVSARLLFFWFLGLLSAAVAGLEIEQRTFRRALMFLFAGMIGASLLFALAKPEWGISNDNRVASGGAWRGLFPGKNLFGLIAVYGLVFPLFATNVRLILRLLVGAVAVAALALAHSQGAVLTAVAMVGYVSVVWLLRRMAIGKTAQVLILSAAVLAVIAGVIFGLPLLLEVLGRDPTLTGRSSVWPQWFARALTQWPTGFGPGSFTELSFVTFDLSAQDTSLGSIHTPHNMFIAIFGEVGLFGFFAFLLPMLYFVLVVPFSRRTSEGFLVGAVALTMLVGGISETREVFGLGMNMFLVIAAYANYRRSLQPATDEPMTGAPGAKLDTTWREGSMPALGA